MKKSMDLEAEARSWFESCARLFCAEKGLVQMALRCAPTRIKLTALLILKRACVSAIRLKAIFTLPPMAFPAQPCAPTRHNSNEPRRNSLFHFFSPIF